MSRSWADARGLAASVLLSGLALLAGLSVDPGIARAVLHGEGSDPAAALLRLSGIEHQLGLMGASVEHQLDLQEGTLPTQVGARMRSAIRLAYDPSWLRATTQEHLRENLDPEILPVVMRWLESERGRTITRLEEEGASPAAADALPEFVAGLRETPPASARIERIRRLDELSGASDLATEVSMKVALATARSLSAKLEHGPSQEELAAVLEARHAEMRDAIWQSMLVSMLYTYRSLSDRELDAYIDFMASPAGRWYNRVLGDAFVHTLSRAADRFGAHMADALAEDEPPVASPR